MSGRLESGHRVLENPSVEDAFKMVHDSILKHKCIILVGNCSADYSGRASSRLGPGERIVIVKSDGSTLVHRPRDYAPVNWQPPGSLFRTYVRDGHLMILVHRRKEHESLELRFDSVYLVVALELVDQGEFSLYASEEDMRDAILIEPSLVEEGFRPATIERPVPSGFIDVLGVDKEGRLTVIEIKRVTAGRNAVAQLKRYVDDLRQSTGQQVRGILAGPEISRGVQALLATLKLEYRLISVKKCAEILGNRRERKITEFPS